MIENQKKQYAWFLQPFVLLWEFVASILKFTGRILGVILGLVLMIIGIILTVTVIGAVVGIPLIIFGFLLMLRGIF